MLTLAAALHVLQLQQGRDDPDQPASVVFGQDQQQCLARVDTAWEDDLITIARSQRHESTFS